MGTIDEIEAMTPALRRHARTLVEGGAAADALVEACLEQVLQQGEAPPGSLRGWMFRILHAQHREAGLPPVRGRLPAPLDRLPEDQRHALLLVAVEGLTLADAAAALEIPEGTLVSRLGRARAALQGLRITPRRLGT